MPAALLKKYKGFKYKGTLQAGSYKSDYKNKID